jgi:hypothetical protein
MVVMEDVGLQHYGEHDRSNGKQRALAPSLYPRSRLAMSARMSLPGKVGANNFIPTSVLPLDFTLSIEFYQLTPSYSLYGA